MPDLENGQYVLTFYQKLLTHDMESFLLSNGILDVFCIIGLTVSVRVYKNVMEAHVVCTLHLLIHAREELSAHLSKRKQGQDFSEHLSLVSSLQLSFKQ